MKLNDFINDTIVQIMQGMNTADIELKKSGVGSIYKDKFERYIMKHVSYACLVFLALLVATGATLAQDKKGKHWNPAKKGQTVQVTDRHAPSQKEPWVAVEVSFPGRRAHDHDYFNHHPHHYKNRHHYYRKGKKTNWSVKQYLLSLLMCQKGNMVFFLS